MAEPAKSNASLCKNRLNVFFESSRERDMAAKVCIHMEGKKTTITSPAVSDLRNFSSILRRWTVASLLQSCKITVVSEVYKNSLIFLGRRQGLFI